MRPSVKFKGIREGLLVTLSDGEWPEVEHALIDQLDAQGDFLRGAKIILNVENHVIHAAALGKLRDQLSDKGITLWAILTNSPTTEQNAQALGMATRIYQGPVEQAARTKEKNLDGDEAILIHRTLRSGARIDFDGHIIVIGDVNPGAELIAGGNVIVWGKLRGMVHAGAHGNTGAVVCALGLLPTQLRIGDKIAISPTDRDEIRPEMAFIRDDKVVAEPWMRQS
ncbi:MAG: septum site-determining protein MinC [Anaerolineales bacterium]|jgi:septum site-determining protein MinC